MLRPAVLGLAALLVAAGCGDAKNEAGAAAPTAGPGPIPVVTVTDVYADIVRAIGGDQVEVRALISSDSGADPHSHEATARDELAVRSAALVVVNGGGYDDFLTRALDTAGGDRTVITAVNEPHSGAGEASPGPQDAQANEHVWYDFRAMSALAGGVAEALGRLRPVEAAAFGARAVTFQDALARLRTRQTAIREKHDGDAVAVTEPLPLYLLDGCGLVNRTPDAFSAAIEEGTEVPARVLQDELALFRDHLVKVLVYNAQTTGPQTDRVRDAATGAGVPVVPMSETLPSGSTYLAWMTANLDALAAALDGSAAGAATS